MHIYINRLTSTEDIRLDTIILDAPGANNKLRYHSSIVPFEIRPASADSGAFPVQPVAPQSCQAGDLTVRLRQVQRIAQNILNRYQCIMNLPLYIYIINIYKYIYIIIIIIISHCITGNMCNWLSSILADLKDLSCFLNQIHFT